MLQRQSQRSGYLLYLALGAWGIAPPNTHTQSTPYSPALCVKFMNIHHILWDRSGSRNYFSEVIDIISRRATHALCTQVVALRKAPLLPRGSF